MSPTPICRGLIALSLVFIGCERATPKPATSKQPEVTVETPDFSLKVPAGWDIRFFADGRLEATDPQRAGPWSDFSLQVIPLKGAEPRPCVHEVVALKQGTACLNATEGGGSHSSGTMVEALTPTHLVRVRHNVSEAETPDDPKELSDLTRTLLSSFTTQP